MATPEWASFQVVFQTTEFKYYSDLLSHITSLSHPPCGLAPFHFALIFSGANHAARPFSRYI